MRPLIRAKCCALSCRCECQELDSWDEACVGCTLPPFDTVSRSCWGAGRSLSLLDPTYASKYIPIIASVSEHQSPAWPAYFTDTHIMVWCFPVASNALSF